jgi:hypothetical protein
VSRTSEPDREQPAHIQGETIARYSFPLADLVPLLRALCCQTRLDVTALEIEIQRLKGGRTNERKDNARKESGNVGKVCQR